MKAVLDLFLAQPLGARSLMQRIFAMAINDGIRSTQRLVNTLAEKIKDPVYCEKIASFVDSPDYVKQELHEEAVAEETDILVCLLRSDQIEPMLSSEQVGQIFNAYVAFNSDMENVSCCAPLLKVVSAVLTRHLLARP